MNPERQESLERDRAILLPLLASSPYGLTIEEIGSFAGWEPARVDEAISYCRFEKRDRVSHAKSWDYRKRNWITRFLLIGKDDTLS